MKMINIWELMESQKLLNVLLFFRCVKQLLLLDKNYPLMARNEISGLHALKNIKVSLCRAKYLKSDTRWLRSLSLCTPHRRCLDQTATACLISPNQSPNDKRSL